MEGLHVFLLVLSAVVFLGHNLVCGSVLEVTARSGENITLYCDCKTSTGVYIVWYRNCSHEKQPPLVLQTWNTHQLIKNLPLNFHFVKNESSKSHDLLIQNITESDEGLYYCGTETPGVEKVVVTKGMNGKEDKDYLVRRDVYTYGNVTRIMFRPSETPHGELSQDCGVYLSLLFSLCPTVAVVSSLTSSFVVYCLCKRKAEGHPGDQQRPGTKDHTGSNQDEEVCYAAVKIHKTSQRPKKMKPQSSDFSTYSAIKTSRM